MGDGHHLRHDVLFLPVCKHMHTQFLQLWTDKSGSHWSSASANTHTHTHTVPTALDRQVRQSWEFSVHEHTQFLQIRTDKSGSHGSSVSANTHTHTHSSYSSGQTSQAVTGVQCPQTHTVPSAVGTQVRQSLEFSVRKHTQSRQLWAPKSGSHWSSVSAKNSPVSCGHPSQAVTGVQCPQKTVPSAVGTQLRQSLEFSVRKHTQFRQLWAPKSGSHWSSVSTTPQDISQPLPPPPPPPQ